MLARDILYAVSTISAEEDSGGAQGLVRFAELRSASTDGVR